LKQFRLRFEILNYRFDNEVAFCEPVHFNGSRDASNDLGFPGNRELVFRDFSIKIPRDCFDAAIQSVLLDIAKQDAVSRTRRPRR